MDLREVPALEILHGDVAAAVLVQVDLEDPDDVGMPEQRRDAPLMDEHLHATPVVDAIR